MSVSVIIANYNGAHLLADCLHSLAEQDAGELDVQVVDNGSIDDSAEVASKYACRFVSLGSNHGLGAAYNRGAELARGDYLFFVNNDMRFERSCVTRLREALEADPERFAADPLQYNWDGDRVIHARSALEPITSIFEVFSKSLIPVPPLKASYTVACASVVAVPWGCGGCLLIRREMFESLGGWDEKFFMDMEDVDLCWRAWLRGWPTVFVPSASLRHKWGASNDDQLQAAKPEHVRKHLPQTSFRRLVSQQHNHLRFALKVLDLRSVFALVGIKLVAAAAYVIRRPVIAVAIVRAFASVAVDLPAICLIRSRIARSSCISSRRLIRAFAAGSTPGDT